MTAFILGSLVQSALVIGSLVQSAFILGLFVQPHWTRYGACIYLFDCILSSSSVGKRDLHKHSHIEGDKK